MRDRDGKEADVRKQRAATTDAGSGSGDEKLRERMLAGVPVSKRRLQAGGVSTMVLEAGEGSPMILLHGGIETGGVYWAPVINQLAKRYRVIVPDSPGLGASVQLARMDATSFSAWLAELIRQTCLEKPVLVAHSLNGSLAARFAASHGGLLEHLVVSGAPGIGRYRPPIRFMVTATRFSIRPTERNAARFAQWAILDTARTRSRDPGWYDAFSAYLLARGRVREVKRTMRQLVKSGTKQVSESELNSIQVPVTLIWGRHDRMAPLGMAEAAHATFGWPLHVIEDAGHVPHIEQPDAFLDVLFASVGSRARS
jgi:pimeloyl-ACP methyl ester carboxylesterase